VKQTQACIGFPHARCLRSSGEGQSMSLESITQAIRKEISKLRLQHFPDCVIDWPIGKLRGNGETESIQDDHYCPRQGFSLETPSRQEKESLAQSL
jgi:hypothetical protein